MITLSPSEVAIVAIAVSLLIGFLLGRWSGSAGGEYQRAFERERAEHIALRKEFDTRITAANERIAELDRYEPNFGARTAGAVAAAAGGRRNDLSIIEGVGRDGETRLNDYGIHSFRDLHRMSPGEVAALEGRLGYQPGRIEREGWLGQAKQLDQGRPGGEWTDGDRRRYAA